MSMEEDDAEKSFEASQKRLDDLRREGRVPRSADLQAAVVYAGFLLAV
ncbi:MAG: EscU/YscU/HrcU family type III secretion system export apparatus switch protein, partial [Gemmobacter sp.]